MYGMNSWSNTLQPGFRFHPTDEELIVHYLKQKLSSPSNPILSIIADVNIYKFNPWDLPVKACFGEEEWFFFSPRLKKYPKGTRPNRAAASGYWKATGTDKPIISSVGSQCLGIKKSLVFYKGRPPKGDKTDWTMIEYRLLDDCFPTQRPKESMQLDDWVLCRLRQRSKIGGSRYCDHQSSSCSSSPQGYLQGQDIIAENNILQDNLNIYHQLLAEYQAFDIPQFESEELDENGQMMMDFQESSPDHSQSTIDSNVRNMLKSIERELSVGVLDELLPSQPEKTLDLAASSSDQCYANPSVFHISPSFSEF